ncbi:MAG TPA: SDR family NAD(P)-dependent oxidoreductase [Puia sp.]|nr:SDR family NAD(P)-dependent oxidoreductase [Puia sp.]
MLLNQGRPESNYFSNKQEMEPCFKDKSVLVTGAGWGIGAAAALLYAANGAKVIVSDTSQKGGNDTVTKIKSKNGVATYIKTDVGNQSECEKLIKMTVDTYGSIDIACNNSAIFSEPIYETDKNRNLLNNEMGLNLNGLQNCMQYEIEAMQKQGGGGVIVNSSSIVGAIGSTRLRQFVAAKYGMATLLQNIPGEYQARGIHINTIAPAFIDTALLSALIQEETNRGIGLFPGGWHNTIQEVAGLVLWLSSDETYLFPSVYKDYN